MKSRTSFFNATVLRKDITRFAPVWGLYLAGMLLICVGGLFSTDTNYALAEIMGVTLGPFSIINFCYALVCAQLLFGDLFNPKLCNALHAMPLRRESWFLSHLLCGIAFSVVPNLVVALCLIHQLGVYWFVSFIWLGGMTLTYLFFFGAAALSAMCTGSRFAMALVYGLINFLSILVLWLLKFLYEPLLYGIEISSEPFIFLSPVSYLCMTELQFLNFLDKIADFYNHNNGWPYLAGTAVVGVVMLIGALLLYRRRQLESAGDFITVRPLAPVFHVLYTLVAGIVLYLFPYIFGLEEGYIFLAVGIVAGFLTGKMLLKRTVKVFKLSTFIGLALFAAVLFGSMGLTRLDVLGLVRWTPQPEQVTSVSIRYNYDEYAYTATSADEIDALMDIHARILDTRSEQREDWWMTAVKLEYTLSDGRTVTRKYPVDYTGTQGKTVGAWFSKPEYVLRTDDLASLPEKLKFIEFTNYYEDGSSFLFVEEEARELLEAIIADCEAGAMVQDWSYHTADSVGALTIALPDDRTILITLWESAEHTVAWLKEHGISY